MLCNSSFKNKIFCQIYEFSCSIFFKPLDRIQSFDRLRVWRGFDPSTSSGTGDDAALRQAQGPDKIQTFDMLRGRRGEEWD